MKNLIVYATTYGCTKTCAEALAQKLTTPTDCKNVKEAGDLDLNLYDTIIMGGSIYMGQLNKELKEWVAAHNETLQIKQLAFFVCCGFPDMLQKHLELNIPMVLLDQAIAKESFGGVLDISKMKWLHKFIAKVVIKDTEKKGIPAPQVIPENIDRLAKAINDKLGIKERSINQSVI